MVSKKIILGIGIGIVALIVIITLSVVLTKSDSDDTTITPTQSTTISAIVDTDCGKVEGKRFNITTDDGQQKIVYTFKGIPYAVPPVNELRWKAPVALNKSQCWSGILKQNSDIICKQGNVFPHYPVNWKNSTEDCLILNIRTPAVKKTAKLPVLIWIHGGSLIVGYGEQAGYHPDEQFTASLDVVTVTVNYRLGLFGFLSLKELWETTGEDKSYANFGVMDNILALKWVRNNILNFGGNPNDITLFGHSSGGTIVYSMITSSLSRGLFTKAILASSSPLLGVSYQESNIEYRSIIGTLRCNGTTSNAVKDCLKNLDADTLLTIKNFTSLIDQEFFPYNVPIVGLPLIVTDPVVIPYGPGMLPVDVGGSLDVFITNTAQEVPFKRPIKDFEDLKSILTPRVDSFKKGLYPNILAMYRNSSDKIMPNNVTAKYIYETMASDILVACANSDVARNLSVIPNYDIYRAVVSQSPDIRAGQPIQYAEHTKDMDIMFSSGFVVQYILTENELKLRSNLRKVYKEFIYSDKSFTLGYKDRPFVFWNNTIVKLDHPYHERECDVWRENGFLEYAWRN